MGVSRGYSVTITPGSIIKGPRWPEPFEVTQADEIGLRCTLHLARWSQTLYRSESQGRPRRRVADLERMVQSPALPGRIFPLHRAQLGQNARAVPHPRPCRNHSAG